MPLTLKRIEIFADQGNTDPLTTFEDDKLFAATTRVSAAMNMSGGSSVGAEDTRKLESGARNVVFVWIELPPMLFHLTIAPLMLNIGDAWTLNEQLTTSSSFEKCSRLRISDHLVQPTFMPRIEGMTKR